jgi:hypothetical protein
MKKTKYNNLNIFFGFFIKISFMERCKNNFYWLLIMKKNERES